MDSLVTIIIPCFNDSDFIRKAVHSALDQTYANVEVIVIDDGSDAKTKKVLKDLEPSISKLITQENQGQSVARNNGIKQARGTYILNLDSDDFFDPTFCEKAVYKFEEDATIKIVTCLAQRFDKNGIIDVFTPRGGSINNFLFSNSALGSSMFKKKDWLYTGGYEEELPILGFEDWEFYFQLLKTGGHAFVIKEILFHYQVRENSTTDRIRDLKLDKFKHIILKHKDIYQSNFDDLIENLFERINIEGVEKVKNTKRIDYVVGNTILKPLRWIKSMYPKS